MSPSNRLHLDYVWSFCIAEKGGGSLDEPAGDTAFMMDKDRAGYVVEYGPAKEIFTTLLMSTPRARRWP